MIEKKERINNLLDLYGNLLTTHQKEICNLYYGEDFSLQEIAEQYDISRAAVSDNLKKAVLALEEYEEKLELLKKEDNIENLASSLIELIKNSKKNDKELLQEVIEILTNKVGE